MIQSGHSGGLYFTYSRFQEIVKAWRNFVVNGNNEGKLM
jgi:hypothetical protein